MLLLSGLLWCALVPTRQQHTLKWKKQSDVLSKPRHWYCGYRTSSLTYQQTSLTPTEPKPKPWSPTRCCYCLDKEGLTLYLLRYLLVEPLELELVIDMVALVPDRILVDCMTLLSRDLFSNFSTTFKFHRRFLYTHCLIFKNLGAMKLHSAMLGRMGILFLGGVIPGVYSTPGNVKVVSVDMNSVRQCLSGKYSPSSDFSGSTTACLRKLGLTPRAALQVLHSQSRRLKSKFRDFRAY